MCRRKITEAICVECLKTMDKTETTEGEKTSVWKHSYDCRNVFKRVPGDVITPQYVNPSFSIDNHIHKCMYLSMHKY